MEPLKGFDGLPPVPEYTLKPMPSLLPFMSDKVLTVVAPVVAYWVLSMLFHWIDVNDYFAQYRLHTPTEVSQRNKVSRWEVVRDVILQQILQMVVGVLLGLTEPDDMFGQEDHDVAVWGRRIRVAERAIPGLLALVGVDASALAGKLADSHPMLAGAVSGGAYASLSQVVALPTGSLASVPAFAPWETLLAKAIYWFLIPASQYVLAIVILDTWQYFLHRAMHQNKWLYTTFHIRHHKLYVPYAYGALYNHPFEGFLLDTLGASLAFKAAGMSMRQGLWFFTGSSIKTVDDHCGYALPWDPLQHLTSNNAGYHDIHHQSWGIKTNFSQPFFTFWDHLLGTAWTGGDVSVRYERDRAIAERKFAAEQQAIPTAPTTVEPAPVQDAKTEPSSWAADSKEPHSVSRKGTRRRTASSLTQSDSLRSLRERVSIHGRTGSILGMEHQ